MYIRTCVYVVKLIVKQILLAAISDVRSVIVSPTCFNLQQTHTHTHTHTHTYTHSDAIAPRSKGGGASVLPVLDGDTDKLEEAVIKGEGRATLRLKKDGQAVVEEVVSDTKSSEYKGKGLLVNCLASHAQGMHLKFEYLHIRN